jgi:hypothetical protein
LYLTDADGAVIAELTITADIDIVIADDQLIPGGTTQCDVAASGRVIKERVNAVDRVEVAGGIAKERLKTVGRVAIACGIG